MFTVESYPKFVASRVKYLGAREADFMHAAVGLLGECLELAEATNRENLIEELGDIEFYLAHARNIFPKGITVYREAIELSSLLRMLSGLAGGLHDVAKKSWVYNKPFNPEHVDWLLSTIESTLEAIHAIFGLTSYEIRSANITKLLKRYPEGYSDEAAQARADKAGESA